MPIFAGIGFALGVGTAATATAAATGVAAAMLTGALVVGATAAAVGTSIYSSQAQATAAKKQAGAFSAMLAGQAQNITDVGRITGQEAQDTVSKRLARVGKYFTSPLGDTSTLSTASQKVFS